MFSQGDRIGPYTLIRKLGEGGLYVIWLAERYGVWFAGPDGTITDTMKVALKIPHQAVKDNLEIMRTAELWKQANGHPNVLPIIEANIYDGQIVIATEYARDGSLEDWLKQNGGKAPSIHAAVAIISGILVGLEHVHAKGIVHRDLKPRTILLKEKTPQIAGFGIALALDDNRENFIAGTPAYLPPEAFEGRYNQQTDVWSAGVTFYELLTGRLPYPSNDFINAYRMITTQEPDPLPPSIPRSIQEVIACALHRDTTERYQSAAEMRSAIPQNTVVAPKKKPDILNIIGTNPKEPLSVIPSEEKGLYRQGLYIGMILNGRYLLEKELGRGGIGVVYLASDQLLHSRRVVIKVLLKTSLENEWIKNKFSQEGEALARINHPNVIKVFDLGVTPDRNPYIVMEFIEGVNLRSVMSSEGMELERVSRIIKQIGQALSAAHEEGISHRDLKPENIMLRTLSDGEEQVILIDFGIARVKDSMVAPSTAVSMVVGTPIYMAPEQLEGKSSAQSDIYALGVIAYEMVTGKRPYNPESPYQLLVLQQRGVTVKPKDLRPGLPIAAEEAILKAISFDPKDRHQRARDFCEELIRALTQQSALQHTTLEQPTSDSSPSPVSTIEQTAHAIPFDLKDKEPAKFSSSSVPLGEQTVHFSPDYLRDKEPAESPQTVILRHTEVYHRKEEHLFEDLVLHKDYNRLWRLLAHAHGGRYVLTGYGPFGGTSLVKCAVAKARKELERSGQKEGALLVFHFKVTTETKKSFSIEATNIGLGHMKGSDDVGRNTDLDELKARAGKNEEERASSVMDFSLVKPLRGTFFGTSDKAGQKETGNSNYDFSKFVADLNSFFKNRKNNEALRQIVLRLVNSDRLPSRVIFIIDRVKYLETLERLFKSYLFSNERISVITVARKEDSDSWENPDSRLRSIGFSKWYVPCLWKINWGESLFNSASGQSLELDPGYKLFLKHLEYIGRGSVGYIIDELRHPMNTNYDDGFSFVDFASLVERADIQHNAWMQEALDLNWTTILGNLFVGRDQDERTDRARNGIYCLVDWIAARNIRFIQDDVIKESQQSRITISDDPEINIEVIQNLLHVLTQNSYLDFKDNNYRVIWNKNQIPKCRIVSPILYPETAEAPTAPSTMIYPQSTASSAPPSQESTIVISSTDISQRNKVFISYSHADKSWLLRLNVHLKPLERKGKIELWEDTKIKAGTKWREEIKKAIDSAKVALLLVSADFLASDFITDNELPSLLGSSEEAGIIILPVIVSPCQFMKTNLFQYQSVNPPSRPLTFMNTHEQEELFVKVAEAIEEALSS